MSEEDGAVPINARRARAGLPEFEQAIKTIPLANLHRLDLKPGETLAVIAPDWVSADDQFMRFHKIVAYMLEPLGVRAAIFPHGTKLDVVSPVDEHAWKDEIQAAVAKWIAGQRGKNMRRPPSNFSS